MGAKVQMELRRPVGIGAGALGNDQIVQVDVLLNGTGGADPDDIFHPVAVEQLMGVNSDGRHAHAGGHHGHPDPLVQARVALNAPDIVYKDRIFQKVFRNKFRPQRITGHQYGFSEVAGSGGDMGSRRMQHVTFLLIP